MDEAIAERDTAVESLTDSLAVASERAEFSASRADELKGALARAQTRIEDLDCAGARLADRVIERERELRELRAELAGERETDGETAQALAALVREIEEVRRQARGQATRIRISALREAADVSERISDLAGRPGKSGERVIEALAAALERVGVEEEPAGDEATSNGHRPIRAGELFEGRLEVDIGPLADFSQLVGFEDAARSIAATSELSIQRFAGGRATLEMNLSEPVELLRELETRCELGFRVRDRRPDRLVLDVGESPPDASAEAA